MQTPGHCQQELIGLLQILRHRAVFGQDLFDPGTQQVEILVMGGQVL